MNEKKPKKLTANDIMKYEIAEELGLTQKVNATGWKSLTAKESGRIGGILAKRKKAATVDIEKIAIDGTTPDTIA